ncbi:CaiB/BaiF CoA transferase family protein [Devosia ginsengisoli]|uniref:CoA transferase n=1 Tax=Devosia ginsengisoli TaxID=400770 RepID=A0A5B8LTV8_9HYPH|nr:CoA transferase [Devosia ginsengisoli]QDZ11653.1 CoA transferase [Devosia ginsengisoli]
MTESTPMRALDGIRILDFTQMMMGPLCTQMLADLGADVIKVERPGAGEWMRGMPMMGGSIAGSSSAFHSFNRNKRSIAIDLKDATGRQTLLDLARECDVVTENFRAGVMDRLGLGYEDFKAVNPRIIYASGSGWGQDTELARLNRPGQDLLVQAMSGVMQNTGRRSDPPTACGTPIADYAASQSMAIGILAALMARHQHGVGQRLEVDLFSSTLNVMSQENFVVLNQDVDFERTETGLSTCWNDAPYGVYPTADGWVAIAMCPLDKLARLVEDPSLAELDPWVDRDAIKRRVEMLTRKRDTDAWMADFALADVWAAPVRTSREVMDDLVATNSDRLIRFEHPRAGTLTAIACPIRFSRTPADLRYPSPDVGEHTEDVLRDVLGRDRPAEVAS